MRHCNSLTAVNIMCHVVSILDRVSRKVSHYQIIKKIVLNPANHIRFLCQIKVAMKIRWY